MGLENRVYHKVYHGVDHGIGTIFYNNSAKNTTRRVVVKHGMGTMVWSTLWYTPKIYRPGWRLDTNLSLSRELLWITSPCFIRLLRLFSWSDFHAELPFIQAPSIKRRRLYH